MTKIDKDKLLEYEKYLEKRSIEFKKKTDGIDRSFDPKQKFQSGDDVLVEYRRGQVEFKFKAKIDFSSAQMTPEGSAYDRHESYSIICEDGSTGAWYNEDQITLVRQEEQQLDKKDTDYDQSRSAKKKPKHTSNQRHI